MPSNATAVKAETDSRTPLEVALAVAERFMQITPPRDTYMYQKGRNGLLDLWEATQESRFLDFYLATNDEDPPGFDWRLYQLTGESRWRAGAEELGERFLNDPRRDREGALLDPRGRYTVDVFSSHFTQPIIFGHLLEDPRFFDEAAHLFDIYRFMRLARPPQGFTQDY